MSAANGKGHVDHINRYVDTVMGDDHWWQHLGYDSVHERLRSHPPGYRRCFWMYASDFDIKNGGFSQYFHNEFGFMTISAIEGYERIGAPRMAAILKSALFVCLKSHPDIAACNDFADVPNGYFDGFVPINETLDELTDLYYDEVSRLPGDNSVSDSSATAQIDFYFEHFPEDFSP